MGQTAQAPSGTRDFLADELRRRKAAFAAVSEVFERYGFDPLETPTFERLDVLTGKYGEEASQLLLRSGDQVRVRFSDVAAHLSQTLGQPRRS